MLPADHPLADLQVQAALATGWPTLHVYRPDEAGLDAAREVLEGVLGPLPQDDVIEPWDPADPAGPWELRIDLPELAETGWEAARQALVEAGGEPPVLAPGVREATRDARDLGYLFDERLDAEGLAATMPCREDGGIAGPDLQRGQPDEAVRELEREAALALQEAGVEVAFTSDRGPDTLTPVVHRPTGRFGVLAEFPREAFETRGGDEVHALRQRIVGTFARLVHARAGHETLRLAPDLRFDTRWGLSILAWIVAPAVVGLPGDQPVRPGIAPFPGRLPARIAALDGLAEDLEVHVVPRALGRHRPVVRAVMDRIEQGGEPLLGSRPRWVIRDTPQGGTWAFAGVWRIAASAAGALVDIVPDLADLGGVEAVRVVPGEPAGLGEAWGQTQPAWHLGGQRWLQRGRDVLTDRDRLPEVEAREGTDRDQAVHGAFFDLLGAAAQRPDALHPVVDTAGRQGLGIHLPERAVEETVLRRVLDAAAGVRHPDLCSVGHWGFHESAPQVFLWFRPGEG